MNYAPVQTINTARHMARSAQRQIESKTGMQVTFSVSGAENVTRTPEYMLTVIAASLGQSLQCYKLRTRMRHIVELRFIGAMFLRTYFPGLTLQKIATLFGGLDHSSIISGLARAYSLIYAGDAAFVAKYNTALQAVNMWQKNGEA